jgi:lysophospholipase L1-like esterase
MPSFITAALLLIVFFAGAEPPASARPAPPGPHWVASWAAAPQHYGEPPPSPAVAAAPAAAIGDATLREQLRPSLGGERIRIRFSNLFGDRPLHIAGASIARSAGAPSIEPSTLQALRFDGRPDITVAPGAQAWSDAQDFQVRAGEPLAVSFRLDLPTPLATVHRQPPDSTWMLPGDAVMRTSGDGAAPLPWNLIVTGLDVAGAASTRVLVAFGDSITEGAGVTEDRGLPVRYPERLADRLAAEPGVRHAVVNAGISGNRLLADWVGPRGIDRFERDVLGQSGVTEVVILIGINDIGFSMPEGAVGPRHGQPTADELGAGLRRLVDEAHARGVKVLLGTLLPFKGAPYWSREKEFRRDELNRWIRSRKDVVLVDFDAALRNPEDPQSLLPADDSGDHLHPGNVGHAAMADAIDLRALQK